MRTLSTLIAATAVLTLSLTFTETQAATRAGVLPASQARLIRQNFLQRRRNTKNIGIAHQVKRRSSVASLRGQEGRAMGWLDLKQG